MQQYVNSSPSRSTGLSLFELLVGKNIRLKEDPALRELIELENIKILQENRSQLHEQASETIKKIQFKNQVTYNRKRINQVFI